LTFSWKKDDFFMTFTEEIGKNSAKIFQDRITQNKKAVVSRETMGPEVKYCTDAAAVVQYVHR
jgi:hypothetical protein